MHKSLWVLIAWFRPPLPPQALMVRNCREAGMLATLCGHVAITLWNIHYRGGVRPRFSAVALGWAGRLAELATGPKPCAANGWAAYLAAGADHGRMRCSLLRGCGRGHRSKRLTTPVAVIVGLTTLVFSSAILDSLLGHPLASDPEPCGRVATTRTAAGRALGRGCIGAGRRWLGPF